MLAGKAYCPVLHARAAEVKALEQLSAQTKNLLFPLFIARPWPNAKHLERTWSKLAGAFPDRPYAVALDQFMRGRPNKHPAGGEFDALFDAANGFEIYYEELAKLPNAVPTVQFVGGTLAGFDDQLARAEQLNRGLVLRLCHGQVANPIGAVEEVLDKYPEVTIFVDTGWTRDLLSREVWAAGILQRIADLAPGSETVVAGGSFPDSFQRKERAEIRAEERVLYDNLVRRFNAVAITYGDWGSAREPQEPAIMKSVPRIDLPMPREWIAFRQIGAETYVQIAARIIADPFWATSPACWGTYMIDATAQKLPIAIRGNAAAAAARINLHLERQANFSAPGAAGDGEEPFTDEF